MLQKDLARAAGVNVRTVGMMERGESGRAQERIRDGISTALGVLPSALFTKEGFVK